MTMTTMPPIATTTMAAVTELASDYIQQCLGFTSLSSKIRSLGRIEASLRKCASTSTTTGTAPATLDADTAASAEGVREEWQAFLEDGQYSDDDNDLRMEKDTECNNFMLRDSFIKCLVESCHVSGNEDDDIVDGGDVDDDDDEQGYSAERLVELSFLCLTLLASLVRHYHHNANATEKKMLAAAGKRKEIMSPIFGRELALAIAPAAVAALGLPYNTIKHVNGNDCNIDGPSRAASALLIELLHPARPKCEARSSASILRESILVPASTMPTSTPSSVARVAHILSSCVIGAVIHATTVPSSTSYSTSDSNNSSQPYGDDELSVREETAALGKLQDMRDVLANVGLVCSRRLCGGSIISSSTADDEESNDQCAHEILDAIQDMFDIAPFAVESQLETLLDEDAKPILDGLRKQDENNDVAMKPPVRSTTDALDEVDDHDIMDEVAEDEREQAELEETIPPLYASIVRPPILSTTIKNLESMLFTISENLSTNDAELWDVRLDALIDLERILAGGVTYMSEDARYVFIERIRKMPLEEQFADLRSQITQQACRVVVAVSYEYREFVVEDMQLLQAVSQFVECCVPPILTLCKSGTKLMANQGVNCLRSLFAVCGVTGYSRTVPRLCDVILEKKAAKNQKRGCVIALTVALRVWDPSCFMKCLEQLTLAVKEGATNKDPTVREEGRKLYWAMISACDETNYAVQNMFSDRSREMKNLEKERLSIDSEWDEDGVMTALMQTGVVGQAPEETAKEEVTTNRTRNASKGDNAPPRNSMKRPGAASARLRALHGTPFKSQRVSTPMKTASTTVVNSNRKHPPSSARSIRLSTPNIDASSTLRMKSAGRKSIHRGHISTPDAAPVNSVDDTLAIFDEEKENSTAVVALQHSTIGYQTTPSKSPCYENLASPMIGTPIVNLIARASPHSAEKVKDAGDILDGIVSMLSDRLSPHEQSLGIKALALFAKDYPCHPSWHEKFPMVLNCLLDHVKNMPTSNFNGPVDFIRSPSKNLSACHQMQHLFLQGVRSLLQYVPGHVTRQQVKDVVNCMLECTQDAPFEIVHTAERALANLVAFADPEVCFEYLLPYTRVDIDLNDKCNPPALLSALRTLRHLVGRVSPVLLKNELTTLLPLFHRALSHKSMDMRKATVFALVEMYIALGEDLDIDGFSDCQRKLIDVYVERHPNRSQMMTA